MIFAIKLEKYVASINTFGIIISKLCHKKKLYLIILFKFDKNPKVSFYYAILSFSLSIYLKIKGD